MTALYIIIWFNFDEIKVKKYIYIYIYNMLLKSPYILENMQLKACYIKANGGKKDAFSRVISDPTTIYLTLLYTQIKCIENVITSVLLYLDLI